MVRRQVGSVTGRQKKAVFLIEAGSTTTVSQEQAVARTPPGSTTGGQEKAVVRKQVGSAISRKK